MSIARLGAIKSVFFASADAARALGVSEASARLACHRYFKKGYLVRPKRDVYVLADKWKRLENPELYALANWLQVPSYVSFQTALSYHQATTQVQRDFIESAAVTRTKTLETGNITFRYMKLDRKLYFGFKRAEGFFMAGPEKAFLDALYLMSLARYRLDMSALDLQKFNRRKLKTMSHFFSKPTRELLKKICNI